MNCINCNIKSCRNLEACKAQNVDNELVLNEYLEEDTQQIVQVAAGLVDGGKAGEMSRLDEIVEFVNNMKYKKVGLAYCYGMETEAGLLKSTLQKKGIHSIISVSCTVGGLAQDEVNSKSCIHHVACNPIGQAKQLNSKKVDITITMGLCLGHDILLNKNINSDLTTFVVKDRVYNHNPIEALINN